MKCNKNIINILLPFVLGGVILWWMYRDFDFSALYGTFVSGMNWWWMLFSLVFGVSAQVFRALRWKQSLEPLDENPSLSNCIHGVFISYASSLIIPRSGEIARCGVLSRYEGTNFAKAIGTVVAERIIDSLLLLIICLMVMLMQIRIFGLFFDRTGTNIGAILSGFSATGYIVTIICLFSTLLFGYWLLKRLSVFTRVNEIINNIKDGILSLRGVEHKGIFAFNSVMIWVSYFLHYWITFLCFDFTSDLGFTVAIVSFIIGSISVIVPTPNGAGPWHFAVKTILILYGVADADAITFVLIVHTVQTALIPLLGILSMFCLGRKNVLQS